MFRPVDSLIEHLPLSSGGDPRWNVLKGSDLMSYKISVMGVALTLLLFLSGCAWDEHEGYYGHPHEYEYDHGYYYGGPEYHGHYYGDHDYDHDRD
jgi:hypothetical protein